MTTMSIFWRITTLLVLQSGTPGVCMGHGIVGGRVSVPHSRPYMVYIRDMKYKSACDGFLVREDFVMTVAHCKKPLSDLRVYLGVNDTAFLPDPIEVDYFPHPVFENTPGNDIMLLRLKTHATLNKTVNNIVLPKDRNEEIAKHCLVMGWGWERFNHGSPSRVLKELNVTHIKTNCEEQPDIICTVGVVGPSLGDSGSPLVCDGVAQGIVSYLRKESTGYFTGYTRISHHLPWIHDVMKNTSNY